MRLKLQLLAKAGRLRISECEAVRLITLPANDFQAFLNWPWKEKCRGIQPSCYEEDGKRIYRGVLILGEGCGDGVFAYDAGEHFAYLPNMRGMVDSIDMTLEFFHIVAETDEQETRTKLLELARTTTDMCGMGDCLFNCGDDAVEMMDQIWAAFLEAAAAENVESRRVLLEKAAAAADELHGLTEPREELEDGRMFMSMDELSAELDEVAHMIAGQNNEPQLS